MAQEISTTFIGKVNPVTGKEFTFRLPTHESRPLLAFLTGKRIMDEKEVVIPASKKFDSAGAILALCFVGSLEAEVNFSMENYTDSNGKEQKGFSITCKKGEIKEAFMRLQESRSKQLEIDAMQEKLNQEQEALNACIKPLYVREKVKKESAKKEADKEADVVNMDVLFE